MSLKTDGTIFIFSSPSGAGKTTLVKLINQQKNFFTSISHTTRRPRTNETDGKDYYFVNKEEFNKLIKQNDFLEYANVFNNLYGTLKNPVLKKLKEGKNVLFDIDWQGAKQIKSQNINYKIFSFFVLPPSKEILFERLSNRDMKDKLIASERMKDFYSDVKHWIDYDFVVINDDLERCHREVLEIIIGLTEKGHKFDYDKKYIEKHIKMLVN